LAATTWSQKSRIVHIATFNINGINRRLANLIAWLDRDKPDVVALQELKCTDALFPNDALREIGYDAIWNGQKSWNGVALLSRIGKPVLTRAQLPGLPSDLQSRYIEAAIGGVLFASIYLPNGNPWPGPKFDYKLAWFDRLIEHAAELLRTGAPVVLAGDFNVVPTEFDMYVSTSWAKNALVQPESRERYQRLLKMGWIDSIRSFFPDDPCYTFWDYLRQRWEKDGGLRIDHLLLSPSLADQLTDAGVSRDVRGEAGASDHAPAWIKIGIDAKIPRRTMARKSH
jgi:exodeoxyribonuclease-3